jgi:hypothetical protein
MKSARFADLPALLVENVTRLLGALTELGAVDGASRPASHPK